MPAKSLYTSFPFPTAMNSGMACWSEIASPSFLRPLDRHPRLTVTEGTIWRSTARRLNEIKSHSFHARMVNPVQDYTPDTTQPSRKEHDHASVFDNEQGGDTRRHG